MMDLEEAVRDHESRLVRLEECMENLSDWQRRQNGSLQSLVTKVDELLIYQAGMDGAIRTLKWLLGFVGFAGIVNLTAAALAFWR